MIVCICFRISDRDILRAVGRGCASFEQLQQQLCVATRCNRCRAHALEVFQSQLPRPGAEPAGWPVGRHKGETHE